MMTPNNLAGLKLNFEIHESVRIVRVSAIVAVSVKAFGPAPRTQLVLVILDGAAP